MGKYNVKSLEAAAAKVVTGERYLSDGDGLYLRVRAGEARQVWFYRYTMNGKARKMQLGVYGDMGLAVARVRANELSAMRRQGIDPVLAEEAGEAAKAEATAAAAEAKAAAAAKAAARLSVAALLDRWQADYLATKRKDGGAEIRRSFTKDVLPMLGPVPAEDVSKGMVANLLDSVVRRGSPVIANYLLADMKQMFNFARARDIVEANPCDGLSKAQFGGAKVERDRVLSETEIRELLTKIPGAKLQKRTEAAIWVMLATGCRVGEISKALWSAVDLDGRAWTIPAEDAKNTKEHRIYLSVFAVKWFEVLKPTSGASQWVFPAENKTDAHVCVKSITKQIGDRQREGAPMQNRSQAVSSLKLSGGDWTPHDLRRTAATLAGELGTPPYVIERMLNHQQRNPLERIYQRQSLEAEQREGWRLLGERLELLTSGASSVVTLKRTA
ncbi:MAG TPA: tyrosine-type recombinase/integrase [Accumulibacter sp.]|uniref:tyrosine-type recombinase/integrase n=1 Tax=Accumulibacter sp. TaxID=2053492 RepID=UPI002B54A299|nr:tyrosine-type recombinase/integrase [Accumulibacter sp.]HRD87490.1 tyrosine-type recombinase/integrase [Accumulibacter sp.]